MLVHRRWTDSLHHLVILHRVPVAPPHFQSIIDSTLNRSLLPYSCPPPPQYAPALGLSQTCASSRSTTCRPTTTAPTSLPRRCPVPSCAWRWSSGRGWIFSGMVRNGRRAGSPRTGSQPISSSWIPLLGKIYTATAHRHTHKLTTHATSQRHGLSTFPRTGRPQYRCRRGAPQDTGGATKARADCGTDRSLDRSE